VSEHPEREQPAGEQLARPIDVGAVERELTRLWAGAQPDLLDEDPVTRACMSNLIVYCRDEREAEPLPTEIAAIVQRHPARVLLLVGHAGAQPVDLEAYVASVCFTAGGGRQICSEHVTITAQSGAARRLPSTTRSLLIGDLPTALWWASVDPPSAGGELFEELADMSHHVIYDSEGWVDPVRSVVAVAGWAANERPNKIISDLAWRRLKPWRRLVGQALDPAVEPGALETIDEVVVEHGPHALPKAWLLIGWLACRLGWRPMGGKVEPGVEVTWGFQSPRGPVRVTVKRHAEGEPVLRRVAISWNGPRGRAGALFSLQGEGWISVERQGSEGTQRVLARGDMPREALVARQLPKLFRDPLFRDTLEVARTMAEALLR
jgi:glucose-6-phosphate dehydrogenase assembly protein OpcA